MTKGKNSRTMEVLSKLREKYAHSNRFEFQQANAHLSMAYTLKIAPEPFELKPWFPIPTPFFKDHKDEVFEVMAQKLSFAWLDNFVSPRFNMENSIKCRNYHDFLMNTERKYSSEFSRLYSRSYNQSQREGLEEEYHQLISKYNDLEREKGSYARQKAQKIDNKWNEVLHRRREIFNKYDFSKHKIIATKELDEYLKVPCKTSWICICDYAVGKLCWEISGIRRNRKTIYRDPDESYCPGGPGVWREFHGKAFDLINPKKYLIDVIEKFSKPTYLSTNEAQENYPEFVVRPDLLESRLFTIKKYLERLDELPDFGESVVSLYKASVNEVRSKYKHLYNKLHQTTNEPLTVRPAETVAGGFTIPKPPKKLTALQLDIGKITALKAESERIGLILGPIFANDPDKEKSPEELKKDECLGFLDQEVMGLDLRHSDLVKLLSTRTVWSRAELEEIMTERKLMLDGVLEHINEAAFNHANMPFTEGDDPIEINQKLVKELYS